VGCLMSNRQLPSLRPCTPLGIMDLLRHVHGKRDPKFLAGASLGDDLMEEEHGAGEGRASFVVLLSHL
jgi:hypothetical protein